MWAVGRAGDLAPTLAATAAHSNGHDRKRAQKHTEVVAAIILQKPERATGETVTTAAHLTARDVAVGQDTAEHAALKVRSDLKKLRS